MFNRSSLKSRPAIPFGHRVYAIGDIHGEAGLLRRVLRLIEEDNTARREATVTLVFVGDLVDRGPDAAAVLKTFARMNVEHVVVLMGNHEEALVQAYHGDGDVLDQWLPFGATATLKGFGVTPKEIDSSNAAFAAALRARIDPDLIDWLEALPSAWECGGYYFTHAGVRPGVSLEGQREADLRWIREPFLSSRRNHGKVIVHGHTVEPGIPALGGNRIGIDTGAHEHGVLTALGLEGERQWLLQATGKENRDEVVATPDGERSTEQGPVHHEHLPMPDIAALIASIVTPSPPPLPPPLLLTQSSEPVDSQPSPVGRPKIWGNSGYVAAGFALVLASIGGFFAVGSDLWPRGAGSVTMPIPELLDVPERQVPKAASTTSSNIGAARKLGERPRRRSVIARPAMADPSQSETDNGASARLYGEALENALEQDRVTTRDLNRDELSRQQGQRNVQ